MYLKPKDNWFENIDSVFNHNANITSYICYKSLIDEQLLKIENSFCHLQHLEITIMSRLSETTLLQFLSIYNCFMNKLTLELLWFSTAILNAVLLTYPNLKSLRLSFHYPKLRDLLPSLQSQYDNKLKELYTSTYTSDDDTVLYEVSKVVIGNSGEFKRLRIQI